MTNTVVIFEKNVRACKKNPHKISRVFMKHVQVGLLRLQLGVYSAKKSDLEKTWFVLIFTDIQNIQIGNQPKTFS